MLLEGMAQNFDAALNLGTIRQLLDVYGIQRLIELTNAWAFSLRAWHTVAIVLLGIPVFANGTT
jgi:hypothetical protein